MQQRVANDSFLQQLAGLFAASHEKGSVYLEQKRLTKTGPDAVLDAAQTPYAVLFRATDGARDKTKRQKFSTVVPADKLDLFWQGYTEALKSGMAGLRRKDKKKARKS